MRELVRGLVMIFVALWSSAALAQERPDLTRFKAFADALVGTWEVTIRDADAKGKLVWEGKQKRVFSYVLADEFLEERALVTSPRTGREVLTGIQFISYDPKRNLLIEQGFWPGHAGTLFAVEAIVANDNRSAAGVIKMPQENDFRKQRRVELKWQGADFVFRTFGKDETGREFLNEELIYRKAD